MEEFDIKAFTLVQQIQAGYNRKFNMSRFITLEMAEWMRTILQGEKAYLSYVKAKIQACKGGETNEMVKIMKDCESKLSYDFKKAKEELD